METPTGNAEKKAAAASPVVERAEEQKNVQAYVPTDEERVQLQRIIDRFVAARSEREMTRDEFDGMSYEDAYLSNRRAAHTYLTPKKNDDEVRVNTGTTEKRLELVLNELLGLNFEGEVAAFDQDDNLMEDVSDVFTDVVKRTEEIELARDKDVFFYLELLSQPSVFVEELCVEYGPSRNKKSLNKRKRCERHLVNGVQMYLGDIHLPDYRFNEQPFLVKYFRIPLTEGERRIKPLNEERWKHVKAGAYSSTLSSDLYRKGSLTDDEIEGFVYMSYPDNEAQVVVQGIPFLEVGKRYTEVFGDLGGYHITMVGLKPFHGDFAYSKALVQSAKTLQALDNETIRNLIRKFRQAIEPPLGVPRGKVYSRDIWNAGAMAQGIRKADFERLIDHQGVTTGELAMFDLIEKKTNEFIGTSQQEPLQGKSKVTATELNYAQKNAIKMLGLSVLAAMRLKQRLTMLRLHNVLANFTDVQGREVDPVTKKIRDVYAKFSLRGVEVDGMLGTRSIQFSDRALSEDEQMSLYAAEQRAKKAGKPFQLRVVDIPALKELDLYFYANVVAKERESSQLDKVNFSDMISQGAAISKLTGRPLEADTVIRKFERVHKERGFFADEAMPVNPQMAGMMPPGMPMNPSQGMMPQMGAQGPRGLPTETFPSDIV